MERKYIFLALQSNLPFPTICLLPILCPQEYQNTTDIEVSRLIFLLCLPLPLCPSEPQVDSGLGSAGVTEIGREK